MQHIYNTEPVHVLCNVHDYDYCASKSPDGFLHNIIWIMQALDSLETGGITISPRPGPDNNPPKPGFPTRPFWGLQPAILNRKVNWYYGLI